MKKLTLFCFMIFSSCIITHEKDYICDNGERLNEYFINGDTTITQNNVEYEVELDYTNTNPVAEYLRLYDSVTVGKFGDRYFAWYSMHGQKKLSHGIFEVIDGQVRKITSCREI